MTCLKSLFRAFAALLAAFVVFAVWSERLSPEDIGPICLVWFAFPYAWLLLAAVAAVALAFRQGLAALVSLAALAYGWQEARRVVDIPMPRLADTADSSALRFKVLTYNIHGVWSSVNGYAAPHADSLGVAISAIDADIVCLQEAPPDHQMKWRKMEGFRRSLDAYPHSAFLANQRTLSRRPMRVVGDAAELGLEGRLPDAFLAVDVALAPGDTVRVFNCHLASLRLSKSQIDAVSAQDVNRERARTLRETYRNLMRAFLRRASEARMLARAVDASPHPVVVCGDFNDPPLSYTFHTVCRAIPAGDGGGPLAEARRPGRLGLARTYRGNLPPLRIDYVFTSASLRARDYTEHDLPTSDHKALSTALELRPGRQISALR